MINCNHKYIKKVFNFGKNSKPSYRICKECGKVMTREEVKKNKSNKKQRRKRR